MYKISPVPELCEEQITGKCSSSAIRSEGPSSMVNQDTRGMSQRDPIHYSKAAF